MLLNIPYYFKPTERSALYKVPIGISFTKKNPTTFLL